MKLDSGLQKESLRELAVMRRESRGYLYDSEVAIPSGVPARVLRGDILLPAARTRAGRPRIIEPASGARSVHTWFMDRGPYSDARRILGQWNVPNNTFSCTPAD